MDVDNLFTSIDTAYPQRSNRNIEHTAGREIAGELQLGLDVGTSSNVIIKNPDPIIQNMDESSEIKRSLVEQD
ncbi:18260_t:CDS:2 [Funneliformis geosporum]|uniref:18260_t:CDS:1 n=1 Tax=Funneliformis geosporum TaxID=1117311 RepID=A0A9W4X0S3_9GLOM|nr:18260_t:CDS:2 [Funneliformis geosporum]